MTIKFTERGSLKPTESPSYYTTTIETVRRQFPVYGPLPTWILISFAVVLVLLFLLAHASLYAFPKTILAVDEPRYPNAFIAEHAYEHVRYLSSDIGYRITGHPNNELLAVNYIEGVIRDINDSRHENVELTWSIDRHSGSFSKETKKLPYINVYRGVQNVVAKLEPKNVNPDHSYILLNAHFDTVPQSPGAGDDATMVGVMLELLRVFAREGTLKHPVVFLFNGCEENGLAASHGFITQNPFMAKVGILLNLEVTGAGGKELMFQTAPDHPWIMNAYSKSIPSAYANVAGEEIYQNGFVQSDTDFSAFQKFGKHLPGIDFAQAHSCYTYHTKLDDISLVRYGSLQHTGNNMIALIKELDNRHEPDQYIEELDEKGRENVYFDYLGLFLVFYSQITGAIINSVIFGVLTVIIGWCVYHIKSTQGIGFGTVILEYGIACCIQILSVILAFATVLFIAWIMDKCNRSMTFYSELWLLFGIYFCPFYFANSILPYIYIKFKERKGQISTSYYVQLANHAHCTFLVVLLILLTIVRIKSAYMLLLSTMFYFFSTFLNVLFNFINKGNKWLYLHCACQVIPSIYYFYANIMAMMTLIPIDGRAYNGGTKNPDIYAAFIVCFFGYLATGFYAPIIVMFKHRKMILASFLAMFGIFLILAATPIGFPFREMTPQRYTIWHAKREFYGPDQVLRKQDAGYYVFGYDKHGAKTLFDKVPLMSQRQSMHDECKAEMICGQPWFRIAYTGNMDYNYWIPASDPILPAQKPQLTLKSHEVLSPTETRYNFAFAGPPYMNVQISPVKEIEIIQWSFWDKVLDAMSWNGRKVYFINYIHGINEYFWKEYTFDFVVRRPEGWTGPYAFDIALSTLYIQEEETKTREFIEFTSSFPVWTNVQDWTAYYVGYQYEFLR